MGTAVLIAAGWVAGWLLAWRWHRLPAASSDVRVSVVVPARDEAARLPRLLACLAADPPHEVVVADDGSTDDTVALALAAGATVATGEPPPGWTGKAWACQRGASAATGDVVVFLDADTEPAPGFVRRLAAEVERTGGVVSVQPWHRVERAYEHLSAVCNVVAVLGAGTGDRPVAYGPAVGVPREAYLAAGGHSGARDDVVDDLALAASLHDAGLPVRALVDDGTGVRYRMYPEGLARLVEGWRKNLATGATRVSPLRTAGVVLWVTAALSVCLELATSTVVSSQQSGFYVAFAVQLGVLFRRVGSFSWVAAVVWPVPFLAFVGLFTWSLAKRVLRRPAAWRGREVPA